MTGRDARHDAQVCRPAADTVAAVATANGATPAGERPLAAAGRRPLLN